MKGTRTLRTAQVSCYKCARQRSRRLGLTVTPAAISGAESSSATDVETESSARSSGNDDASE